MSSIRTYQDLIVWQKSMELVEEVYRVTGLFPGHELYGLCSQLRRAAVSLPSNIAEGYGRQSKQDYIRFLRMAIGSLYELQTQLEIAVRLEYLAKSASDNLYGIAREVERMLSSLIRKVTESQPHDSK